MFLERRFERIGKLNFFLGVTCDDQRGCIRPIPGNAICQPLGAGPMVICRRRVLRPPRYRERLIGLRRFGGRFLKLRDPLDGHRNLLTVYTDKDIHDVTAYLVTLK